MVSGCEQRKRRRARLWKKQRGRCYWCGDPMVRWEVAQKVPHGGQLPKKMATIDHFFSRRSPMRSEGNFWVLACWECNNKRAHEEEMTVPIDERRVSSWRGVFVE